MPLNSSGLKEKYGFEPQLVEYGPGLCVEYFEDDWQEKEKQSLDEAAEVLREFAVEYPLGIEMGRFLAASCGKYYTQVKDLKSTGDANYAILDGGIHHLNYFGQRMAMQVPPISIYSCRCGINTIAGHRLYTLRKPLYSGRCAGTRGEA